MAKKLFVFGIGGTGSRVIKSLVMLLASGVKLENDFNTVVPIIIDPDTANGDLDRTSKILEEYQNIRANIGTDNNFFDCQIKTLSQLAADGQVNTGNDFKFIISGTSEKFGDSIGYNGLEKQNKAFVDLLFSQANIEADMTVGFKGNPNIGSIVLNKFIDAPEYDAFINAFNPGDSIFIISSIFGGTGASGFPLLLKNLRNNTGGNPNIVAISESIIGAISYLPYFKVQNIDDDKKEIDSSTFFGKAKAALHYYEHSVFGNNTLDAFYYLGNHANSEIPYATGDKEQKNKAHFLELAGALSIIDFAKNNPNLERDAKTIYREFGITEDVDKIKFNHLGVKTKRMIGKPLSKFQLFNIFLQKSLETLHDSKGLLNKSETGVPESFFEDDFFIDHFKPFMNYFDEWLNELELSKDPTFSPYHKNQEHNDLLNYIKDKDIKRTLWNKRKASANNIIKGADAKIAEKSLDKESIESRFIKVFDSVFEKQVDEILK